MKKIIFYFALLLSIASFGQKSEYNRTTKFEENFGHWSMNDASSEIFITTQNPVGYKRAYNELKKVLEFYELDLTKPVSDGSLIPNGTTLQDFTEISNNIYLEMAEVQMIWRGKTGIVILFICTKESNSVFINLRNKKQFQ